MRVLLLALLVAVAYSMPADIIRQAHQSTIRVQREAERAAHNLVTLEDNGPNVDSFCNGSFIAGLEQFLSTDLGSLLGGMGTINVDLSRMQNCFSGLCGLIGPGNTCLTFKSVLSNLGSMDCPTVSGAIITQNCGNGCLGKAIGPLAGLGVCIQNALVAIFPSLIRQLCALLPAGEERDQCNALANSGELPVPPIADEFPTSQLAAVLNGVCSQNPATNHYCYADLLDLDNQLPVSGDLTDAGNCEFLLSLGCCATGLIPLLNTFNGTIQTGCTNSLPYTAAELKSALAACAVGSAHLNNIPACPAAGVTVKIVKVTWSLTGLLIGGINGLTNPSKKAAFIAALVNDFGASISLPAASRIFISIGTIVAAASGSNVVVTWTIRGASDTETNTFGALVAAFLAGSGGGDFTQTTAFASANSGISSGTVGLDRTGSSSQVTTQQGASGAASLTSSVMVVLVAALLAMLRF